MTATPDELGRVAPAALFQGSSDNEDVGYTDSDGVPFSRLRTPAWAPLRGRAFGDNVPPAARKLHHARAR